MKAVIVWLVVVALLTPTSLCQQNDVINEEEKGTREERQLDDSEMTCRCGDPGPWCPVTRPDPKCPCRKVCALRQSGQSCDQDDSPCHSEFGLKCHPELRICQGKLQLQTTEVTHRSVALRWRPASLKLTSTTSSLVYTHLYRGAETQWTQGQVKDSTSVVEDLQPNTEYFFKAEENEDFEILAVRTKDGCVLNETSSVGLGETYHRGCDQTCECRQGGQSECRERCQFRPGSISNDPACEEVPDTQDSCCVMYKCQDNPLPSSNAKVLVTQRTPSSLTLAWDDFKLPNYESGYIVEYRPVSEENKDEDWKQVQAANIPLMTLTKLKPHTAYQVRVLVWEDAETKKRGTSSELVTIFTEDGCVRGNQTLAVGTEYHEACDQTCLCKGGDEGECRPRCSPPFYRTGTGARDPLCSEEPVDSDPCCVTVRCQQQDHTAGREAISFSDKGGTCPSPEVTAKEDCPSDCDHDHDCPGNLKCCANDCGKSSCIQPLLFKGTCETVFCGSGSICVPLEDGPICQCQEGFTGDPNSLDGCTPLESNNSTIDVSSMNKCHHQNSTYKPGENFFIGCEKRCQCGEDLEVSCVDRCIFNLDEHIEDPLCEILTDPHDACCKLLACETGSINETELRNTTQDDLLEHSDISEISQNTPVIIQDVTEPSSTEDAVPDTTILTIDSSNSDIETEEGNIKNATQRSMKHDDDELPDTETQTKQSEDIEKVEKTGDSNTEDAANDTTISAEDITTSSTDETTSSIDDTTAMTEIILAPESSTDLSVNETTPFSGNDTDTQPPMAVAVEDEPPSLDSDVRSSSVPDEQSQVVTEILDVDMVNNETDANTMSQVEQGVMDSEANSTEVSVPVNMIEEHEVHENETTSEKNSSMVLDLEEQALVPEVRITQDEDVPMVTEEVTTTENETKTSSSPPTIPERKVKMEDGTGVMEITPSSTPGSGSDSENVEDDTPRKKVPTRLDGCEYNNATYRRGEQFFDGCEARCHCDGPGLVSCVPRCALISAPEDQSAQCKEVGDPSDACCKILVCERPGDTDAVQNVDELKLIVESAEPQNATTVRLRVTLQASENETLTTGDVLQVWYAPASATTASPDTEHTTKENNENAWKKDTFKLSDMQQVRPNVYELDIQSLEPHTEYYLKVKRLTRSGSSVAEKGDAYSNTVNVKTFPKSVRGVFKGCFHKNQSYEAGQVFNDGCQYKCVCHERGLVQCQDRCDQYIDTVGFEHCQWGPAPDDPCCTVPYCNEKPPKSNVQRPAEVPDHRDVEIFCTQDGSSERHPLGSTWELGEGCKRKACTCSMRSNGTTLVECSGGCPPIPASVQHPTPECPQPILVTPDDVCLCPYILCNNAVNPLSLPTPMCEFKGRRFHVGEEFYDGCRAACHCGRDLRVNCAVIECPHHFAAHVSQCLEWDVPAGFVPSPPNCCPPAKCKNDGSCVFDGVHLPNFQAVPQDLLDCGTRCVCVNGNVTCENRCPQLPPTPPANLPCPPVMAHRGYLPGDDCCSHWVCREPEESMTEGTCMYDDKRYAHEEQWEVRRGTLRRLCLCRLGQVDCRGGCPPIPERFRSPGPQCPKPVLVTPDDPIMCPYVVCNHSLTGKGLQNVSVVALNSTAVRVRFSLPSLLVGLVGHAELHFTTDPSVARESWHIQKFARPKRLFDTANIEYHLTGLRSDTTYFFQVVLAIDALQAGPKSDIYKLRLPPASVAPAAGITEVSSGVMVGVSAIPSTSTTSTPPPMIMVDAMLSVQPLSGNSVNVTWRPFDEKEKSYIDGLRLKYKKANENTWTKTSMIHRDVSSYVIQDLEPSASYLIDMEFSTPERIPTHLVSSKPLSAKTADPPKVDDFSFQVSVKPSVSSAFSSNLSVQGVPEPPSKYVNIARITYKSDTDAEQTVVYKPLLASHVLIEQLKPGRRYKVWVDLLLTNGKTVSSNVVEVMTKAAPPGAKSLDEPTANFAEALQSGHHSEGQDNESRSYYIALIVVAVVAAVAALGFVALLVILLRRQSSAKAPITRNPSEAAYDNPTYKTYDGEQRGGEHAEKNGNGIQA